MFDLITEVPDVKPLHEGAYIVDPQGRVLRAHEDFLNEITFFCISEGRGIIQRHLWWENAFEE